MSYDYTGITNSATNLITRFGKSYTFTRTTNGGYNPATGTAGVVTTDFTKYACVFNYTDQDRADGTILASDRRMLVESGDYQVGDTVVLGSDVYQVINVSPIAPSGDVVAANLQVRK